MSSQAELNNGFLYVNSFAKKSGSDYKFSVQVPQTTFSQISLVQAGIDMWMPNLYDTKEHSFSQFGLQIDGSVYKCDVFIQSVSEFVQWYNDQSPRYKLQQQAVSSYRKVFSFRVQDSQNSFVNVSTALLFDGWQKLGFVDYSQKLTHTGSRIFDLSLPPEILIKINNPPIKNNIQSYTGQAHFSITNNSNFGGKLLYQNDFHQDPKNTIFCDSQISVQHMEIELLNCDFFPLYSCDFGQGRDNNDAEVVLVFATRK